MIKAFAIALAFAADDDDKVPAADLAKFTAALADLGCKDPEGVKKEQEGIYKIDDAKCTASARWVRWTSSSTKNSVILISRY